MSMKRTKQASRGRRDADSEYSFMTKTPEKTYSWPEDVAGQPDTVFVAYAMTGKFTKGTLLNHPKFGKGVVTGVEGTRVEVLFEDGPKKLGHAGS